MPADRISRTTVVDGVVTPGFIHNGGTYFFVNLQVFADGLVECWDLLDLRLFREKLRSGWVATAPPAGAQVSVHGLASWTIARPEWQLNVDDLFARVELLVRELNPNMENLYDCHGSTIKIVNGVKVARLGMVSERPLRFDGTGWIAKRVQGDKLSMIVRDGDDFHLANVRVFADGVIEIGRLAVPETTDVDGLRAAVEAGRIVGSVPVAGRVRILDRGSFIVEKADGGVDPREQLLQVKDMISKLNGTPDSVDRCRTAYDDYIASPSEEAREVLRGAYEAVPKHQRMYVGDMDTKDIPVRMIVYGDQELESWSHRLVARQQGMEPLPEILVPKPPKK